MKTGTIPYKLNGANYRNTVLRNSLWENQREDAMEMYLSIDNDALMHPFRVRAGLPAPGNGLAGWYGRGASTFGQQLAAFAKLYSQTSDFRLYEKAVWLADEWGKCADASEDVLLHNGPYSYDKLIGGFIDMYLYMDYKKGLDYISRLTDAANKVFTRSINRDGLQDTALVNAHMIEWYTLPEQILRAYELTGDEKYKTFALEWDYPYYWDKFNSGDYNIGPRHAYSHVNCLSSGAMLYRVTGDKKYLSAIETACSEILAHHVYVTGGYGPAECLYNEKDSYLGDLLLDPWNRPYEQISYRNQCGDMIVRSDTWGSCEISCCVWAIFKLCDYLVKLTGDAKYADWAENALYNCAGGQPAVTPDGEVMYYADYFMDGGHKYVEDRRPNNTWQCCTGTWPQDVAEYSNLLYYTDDSGVYVSQYLPSGFRYSLNNKDILIENYSAYPEDPIIKLRIETPSPARFVLRLRVPSWAKGKNAITVNGNKLDIAAVPGTWAEIDRIWEPNDLVTAEFSYSLEFVPVDAQHPKLAALRYGPLVMVGDTLSFLKADMNHPEGWIEQVEGVPFTFRTKKGAMKDYDFTTLEFKPYYSYPYKEWYFMYYEFI